VIIPRPTCLTRAPGAFHLPAELNLSIGPGAERPAALLAGYLGADRPRTRQGPEIRLETSAAEGPAESYRLDITEGRVLLTAPMEAGLFYGVQTVRQLLAANPARLPCLTIEDAPLLPWRGLMIDVARHFMPLTFLYELIDDLALLKLNVLHLHLTDDQGWRIEIDGLPRLTEVGAWRSESMVGPAGSSRFDGVPHGGYYTRAELAALVRHAADRGIRVVPEIELPGHARAALAAYPELGVHGKQLPVWTSWGICEDIYGVHDAALGFLCEVLDQTVDIFPDRYVHLGGDECPTAQWESDAYSRRKAAELDLPSPAALHGWFLDRMRGFLADRGRRAVSWDNAAPEDDGRLPADLVLAAWLDPNHALRSIARGHQVLLTPHQSTFFDYPQHDRPDEPQGQPGGVTTLEDAYAFRPLHAGDGEHGPGGAVRADGSGRRGSGRRGRHGRGGAIGRRPVRAR
jgi:hexosaminidase